MQESLSPILISYQLGQQNPVSTSNHPELSTSLTELYLLYVQEAWAQVLRQKEENKKLVFTKIVRHSQAISETSGCSMIEVNAIRKRNCSGCCWKIIIVSCIYGGITEDIQGWNKLCVLSIVTDREKLKEKEKRQRNRAQYQSFYHGP